jgi:hypothetical protein
MIKYLSKPNSIEEYIDFEKDSLDLLFWVGGRLKPFIFIKNRYQWLLFQIYLEIGYYRIALTLGKISNQKSITAYAVAFLPDSKDYEKYPLSFSGYGFHKTPAIANTNSFFLYKNICQYNALVNGLYTIGVTTRDWISEVENVKFELAVFKELQSLSC